MSGREKWRRELDALLPVRLRRGRVRVAVALLLLAMTVAVGGCGTACPSNISCDANLRLTGNVTLGAQTTAVDVRFCFNSTCQHVALDLENKRCASLNFSADSVVCASAPKDGATTIAVSLILANDAVHDGDRYAITVTDSANGAVLASQNGTFKYSQQSSNNSVCDLPACNTATVSF